MSSEQRLQSMLDNNATVLLCTPSYALRLAEIAEQLGLDIKNSSIVQLLQLGSQGDLFHRPVHKLKIYGVLNFMTTSV